MKHDLIVYENSNDGVRVCLLISETTHLPDQIIINSSSGSWDQQIEVQNKNIFQMFEDVLWHFNTQFQNMSHGVILVYKDWATNPFKRSFSQQSSRVINEVQNEDISFVQPNA